MDEFIERCINGEVRTYSQRYCKEPEILSASSKQIINELDGLIESMIDAAQKKDFLLVEQSLKKIYSCQK